MQTDTSRTTDISIKIVYKIALIGVFSALSYVGTMIHIPIPSPIGKPMIHFGNLVVIIASLIFGEVVGGVSGSIGMGLYDFVNGYGLWSVCRTIILKLLMGLIVGFIYKKLIKKERKSITIILPIIGSILLITGIIVMIIAIKGIQEISWPSYVFSIINGLFLIITGIIGKKLPYKLQVANLATSVAMVFNICGEFIYKVLKQATLGATSFEVSFYQGLLSVPATLINATITLTIVLLIFIPIEEAVRKSLNK